MSVDISKYMDVSSERRSPVWNHMLLHKEKGEGLCKIFLDKKVTKTVYAKNGSIKNHFRSFKRNTWHRKKFSFS